MLSDDELNRLRGLWTDAAIAPISRRADRPYAGWDSMIVDPNELTIREFFHDADTPVAVNMSVFDCVATIGMAVAGDILVDAPLPLDRAGDRRWQLRRELTNVVDLMDDDRLQRLVHWARSIAQ